VSFDRCHLGVESDYNIRAGRSAEVTGPYRDRTGRPLLDSGGNLVFESQGDVRGPGHNSVLQHNGKTWIAFHYFNDPQRKGSRVLQVRSVSCEEGWPRVGEPVGADLQATAIERTNADD
jgi:arabinan endo-1,5-alpha-L-arabinosidase